MHTSALLQALSNAFGVSGLEDDVRAVIHGIAAPFADDVRTDTLGNLLVTRRGRTPRTLMLDAHMDEVGLMISHVEDDGFLRFATIGGWDPRILPAHAVTIRTRSGAYVRGVIGSLPPHILSQADREKPVPLDGMFIDIGARSAEEVAHRGVRLGDPAVPAYPCETLPDGWIMGKALDDRVGCAVMIKVLEALAGQSPELTLVCNFAVGEETGLRGARTAAHQIAPVLALALEGTVASDVPGVSGPRRLTSVGRGPAISLADRSMIMSPRFIQALERVAEEHRIAYQHKRPMYVGTDAGAIHTSGGGVLAGAVSVPCRYIHAPLGLLRLSDVEDTIRLVSAFVQDAARLVE
jgi:endoglucanase